MPLNETDPPVSHSRRSAFAGVLIGVTALIGTIVGVAAIASAEDTTVTGDDTAPETTIPVVTVPAGAHGDEIIYDESQLPDDVLADIEAWRPYEECVDEQVGDLGEPVINAEHPAEADWEAYDAAWQAADEACRELLPDDVQAEMAAWDAFDECINDAAPFGGEFAVGATVQIETPDGFQMVEFGDIEGSVTITGTADGVTVTSTGGVAVLDESTLDAEWEAFDAAQAECEQLLPEDAFG
jgi:hypothetical protein